MKTLVLKNENKTYTVVVDKILYILDINKGLDNNSDTIMFLTHGDPIVFTNDISAQLDKLELEGTSVAVKNS